MEVEPDFYVIGIGASAGGLDAVQQLFNNMPPDTGNAFIIIQHLSPDFKSLMPELLSKHTQMEIFTAEHNQEIKPNCIYLNSRNKNIGIKDRKFILLEKAPKDHLNLPIDILFHMLGESFKDKSVGVILSGTGSDGSRGIKTIKEAGGTIMVQEPQSAQFNGMPNAALMTNLADFVLPPNKIAEKIVSFTNNRILLNYAENENLINEETFQSILSEIKRHTGINFKNYKYKTLLRRIEKRMSLHNIDNLPNYYSFLIKNPHEKTAVKQEFLIGVTSFFRDKEAFEVLWNKVIPMLCNNKNKHENIRIWIPGCSSGEEVYSIAILFEDYIRNNKLGIDYKIFATDVDKLALQRASHGKYSVNNCTEIDRHHLEEYFIKSGENIQIIKKIRERIVFSYHDLTNDPPFINMDLVSCRNLMIYLNNSLQQKVLANFQFALKRDGILFLGSSESLGNSGKNFKVLDAKWKIFLNPVKSTRNVSWSAPDEKFNSNNFEMEQQPAVSSAMSQAGKKHNEQAFYKYLGKKHSPVSVFVDKDFNLQFMLGDFKLWFSQKDGLFSNNLLNLVDSELATVIRNGIRRLNEKQTPVSIRNVVLSKGDQSFSSDLFFEKATGINHAEEIYLIQFGKGETKAYTEQIVLSGKNLSDLSRQRIEDLEYELKEAKTELQNVVEELETSNEELQSSNEELMSSNEELQSSNEELQSANEELYTINTELQEKNRELENLHNDINNLFNSTDIGTLFLDTNLNIRKFTPAIKRIFKLEDSDVGRSIASFASEFDESTRKSMISDTRMSLEKLQYFEKEIQDNKGNWYLKRISPFVTADKKIEGVVITFVDINHIKQTRENLKHAELRLTAALEAGHMAWWEMEQPSGKMTFSRNKSGLVGRNPEEFTYYNQFMNFIHPDDYLHTRDALRLHMDGTKEVYECEYRIKNSSGSYQWFHDMGKIVYETQSRIIISGISIEITAKKKNEADLLQAMKKAETSNIYKNQFLANISHEIRTPMNGLVSFASMLRNDNLDSYTRNKYVDIIESSSKQLLNLINDIIDISKIEAGELNINISSCNLKKMFRELEATFNKLKVEKNKDHIRIISRIPEDDLIIKTDPERLRQVLINLVGNSMKFTREGQIEMGYYISDNNITFFVNDTGIGMAKEKLDLIFERFQRLEHDNEADYEGTGLGLSISKGIIELLNGSFTVNSEEGQGSAFEFTIPLVIDEFDQVIIDEFKMPVNFERLNGHAILIAEDDLFNRIYLEEILKEVPVTTYWAQNGQEVVDLFRNHDDIALILMDIRMPKLSGMQAAQQILQIRPGMKIIAQTAHAMSDDREQCLKNGFVDYISKPLEKEKLFELINKWIE